MTLSNPPLSSQFSGISCFFSAHGSFSRIRIATGMEFRIQFFSAYLFSSVYKAFNTPKSQFLSVTLTGCGHVLGQEWSCWHIPTYVFFSDFVTSADLTLKKNVFGIPAKKAGKGELSAIRLCTDSFCLPEAVLQGFVNLFVNFQHIF